MRKRKAPVARTPRGNTSPEAIFGACCATPQTSAQWQRDVQRDARNQDEDPAGGLMELDKLLVGVLLQVIGVAEVGIEHLLSAELLATGRGISGDKYGIDRLH
jgi:hypothetical protein